MGDTNDVIRPAILLSLVWTKPDEEIGRRIQPVRSTILILLLLKTCDLLCLKLIQVVGFSRAKKRDVVIK
jgi:hypothetical protein